MTAKDQRRVVTAIEPVEADRWGDLEALFGPSGAYSGCWCTWWRMSSREWEEAKPVARRRLLERLVRDGRAPGLLAYVDDRPVGWVAVSARAELPRLNRSPHTKAVDDVPVWAVSCFWIARPWRGRGVARALLGGAIEHAAARGAPALEGYPVDPAVRSTSAAEAFTGVVGLFERAGFVEVARRSATSRVVMRREL